MGNIPVMLSQYYLIGSLCLEFGEQICRLGLGSSGSHVGDSTNRWLYGVWCICGNKEYQAVLNVGLQGLLPICRTRHAAVYFLAR